MKDRGFTLVEVLVALAIVAVALLACVRAVGAMTQSGAELKLRLLAQLSAGNRIAYLRATSAFPPTGVTTEPCPQGEVRFVCEQEVKPTPNQFFQRVEVRVRLEDRPGFHFAELVGIVQRK